MNTELSKFSEALSNPHWRNAMCSEIDALSRNQTWHITALPPSLSRKKALGCKWVYKIKHKYD